MLSLKDWSHTVPAGWCPLAKTNGRQGNPVKEGRGEVGVLGANCTLEVCAHCQLQGGWCRRRRSVEAASGPPTWYLQSSDMAQTGQVLRLGFAFLGYKFPKRRAVLVVKRQ